MTGSEPAGPDDGAKRAASDPHRSDTKMKKKWIIIAAAGCLLPCMVMAADSTTTAALATVAAALKPIIAKLDPSPTVDFPEHTTSLVVMYLPQTYKIHGRSKSGQVSTNVYDQVGPGFKGFVLRAHVQPRGEVNQACTPQTIREPYWQTDLDVTPIGTTDKQAYWALSYMGRTPTNVLAEIRAALKGLEKSPNQASDATSEPAPGAASSAHQR